MPIDTLLRIPRRRLGRTELSIPVVPFGTQGFGNNFGFVSDEDAVSLIKHAVSIGVNHFDCARCYGDSMRKLGLALKEIPREDVIVTGRLCCHSAAKWGGYGEGRADYSADRVLAGCRAGWGLEVEAEALLHATAQSGRPSCRRSSRSSMAWASSR